MLKTKTITTDKATVLVVELPEGAYYPNICQLPPSIGVNYFLYENGVNTPYKESLDIPKGNWQLIGRMPDITEEQAHSIVDKEFNEMTDEWFYRNYSQDYDYNYTVGESLYSLLQANEVYFENRKPWEKDVLQRNIDNMLDKESQSKVFDKERTFLFIKVD